MSIIEVSIVIPSYKPKSYLWECLESLRNQTFSKENFEIILVLNGCNEPYFTDVNKYIATHLSEMNINFIQTNQGGVSNARNIALSKANGKYITFIDDDDYVSESYIEEMYEIAEKGYTPIANLRAFNDGEKDIYDIYVTDQFNSVKDLSYCNMNQVRSYMSSPVAKLLQQKNITNNRFNPNFTNGEDALFIFSISNTIGKIKCTTPKAVYFRRYRKGSAISQLNNPLKLAINAISLSSAFFVAWLKDPFSYNFSFFLTRIAAPFKGLIKSL